MSIRQMKMETSDIINTIKKFAEEKGIVVYLVGGYIRDKILRRKSKDIDIVMEFDAMDFARLFSKKYGYPPPVFYGKFGTAMVEIDRIKLEFATCRKESYAENSRKPSVYPATIYEDLARRDFTINAIAQNLLTGEILDPFEGKQDIKDRLIKTPIEPDKTFFDDPLRILRGIRFAARFKFEIEKHTKEAMKKNVFRLKIVSEERIADEILKMSEVFQPSRAFYLLEEIDALKIVLPEVSGLKEEKAEYPCKALLPHTLKVLDNASLHTKNVYLRLAALLHDVGKPKTFRIESGKVSFHRHEFVGERMAYKICGRLKIGSEETRFVGRLIRFHLRPHLLAKEGPTDKGLRRFIREIGKGMKSLFCLAKADLTSQNPLRVKKALEKLNDLEKRVKEINKRDKISSFKLAIDGFTIMEVLGIDSGKPVGYVKKYLENLIIDGVLNNKKRELKKYLLENKMCVLQDVQTMVIN